MSLPDTSPQARKRSPLLLVFGGCAVLLLCGVMPNDYQQQLDQQALADLIAFLKTR